MLWQFCFGHYGQAILPKIRVGYEFYYMTDSKDTEEPPHFHIKTINYDDFHNSEEG